MKCDVQEGRIVTESCEVNVVHHCNLNCRGCCHLSPIMAKKGADPDILYDSLRNLGRALSPKRVQLVGGEPLLHPRFLDVIKAVRAANISQRIRVISNATLLRRLTPDVMSLIDDLHLSLYPGFEPAQEDLSKVRSLAHKYDVKLEVKHFDCFREPFATLGTSDADLVHNIYWTCKMAHTWHCHTVEGEYFFKCPQAVFLNEAGIGKRRQPSDCVRIDGRQSLLDELKTFLESPVPLSACSSCLGSVGRLYGHEQRDRREWRSLQEKATEDLLDREYLLALRSEMELDNMCVRSQWVDPANARLVAQYPALAKKIKR